MKWILVPHDVQVFDELTGVGIRVDDREYISFFVFVVGTMLRDQSFGEGLDAFDDRASLLAAFREHRPEGADGPVRSVLPGDKVPLEDRAYQRLMAALRNPKPSLNAIVAGAFRPFFSALRNAKDKPEDLVS